MNNEELIKALRYCKEHERCDNDSSAECPYEHHWTDGEDCQNLLLADAADALEAAEQRIAVLNTKCANLQSQINSMENEIEELMPKEGEWIVDKKGYPEIICSLCGVHIPMVAGWCMDAHINYCPNCGARMRGAE